MPTRTTRAGARRRPHRARGRGRRPRPEPPMGLYAAITTLGADQVAHATHGAQPFGVTVREKIATTIGPERTAWRALAHHGAGACRDALSSHGIYLFAAPPHRHREDQP